MRSLKVTCLLLAIAFFHTPALAMPILDVDGEGQLIGAFDIAVEGALYDVEFIDGSCIELFDGCDVSSFAFTTQTSATAAAQALLDLVFVGIYDTRPDLTRGCSDPSVCSPFIPWAGPRPDLAVLLVLSAVPENRSAEADAIITLGIRSWDQTTTGFSRLTYARFSRASSATVPSPGTFMLVLLGLVGMFVRR